jgi:hypothetical protein
MEKSVCKGNFESIERCNEIKCEWDKGRVNEIREVLMG